jgi:carboxylesterase
MPDQSLLPDCEPLAVEGGPYGALVLHGFTGCPQSVRPLAMAFAEAGFGVQLPLLPGHGTTVDDIMITTWADWTSATKEAYAKLAARCERIVVAGLSMGASLALWLSSRQPEIAGLICINPLVRMPQELIDLARQLLETGEDRIPAIGGDIADPDGNEVAYPETPLEALLSLGAGTDELRSELGKIACPVLLMTSPQDHVVPPVNSDELATSLGGSVERVSLDRSYHVATLDYDRELIRAQAVTFAQRVSA